MEFFTAANLLASALQVALLGGAMALALWLLRVREPGTRYAAWRLLVLLAASMPFIQPWHVTTTIVAGAQTYWQGVTVARPSPANLFGLGAALTWLEGSAVVLVITAGCVARLLWISWGLLRLRRALRTAAGECAIASDVQDKLGTHATVYYVDALRQPATFGWLRPVVLLPSRLKSMDADIVRAVLVHELLHVKRRDWPVLVLEETVRALYWFNPFMWCLIDRLQLAREEVVDIAAVSLAGGRRSYVRALLSFADAPLVPAAPAFAERRHLFTRITRLYEESAMSTRRAAVTALLLGLSAVAASAAAVTTFPFSGGEDVLVAPVPGPSSTVVQDPPPPPPPPPPAPPTKSPKGAPPPPPPPPPRVVYEVKPRYPAEAIDAKVQGNVQIEVTIAEDGSVTSARVLRKTSEPESSLSKALDEAALEAAKQWKFNRVPKGGITKTVEFTFTLRDGPPRKKAPK